MTQSSSIEVIHKSSVYRNVFVHYLYKHVSAQAENMSDVTVTSVRDINISVCSTNECTLSFKESTSRKRKPVSVFLAIPPAYEYRKYAKNGIW
jgi:hypothetical protein